MNDTAPIATVSLDTPVPRINSVLTATATKSDADGDPVSLTFVWEVNGAVRQTRTLAPTDAPLTDTFDLSAGNVKIGDAITVVVTPNDGIMDGCASYGYGDGGGHNANLGWRQHDRQ